MHFFRACVSCCCPGQVTAPEHDASTVGGAGEGSARRGVPVRASGCASARASAHAGKRADSHVLSEVCASVRAVQVRVLVRRESVRACARACRATTGPGSPWCRETPCGAWSCARAAMTDGPCRRAHGSPSCRRRKLCAMFYAQAPLRSGLCVLPSRLRDRRCPTAHAVLCSLPSCRRRKLCAVSYAQAPLRRGLCRPPSRTCERRRPTAHAVVCSRSLSCQGGSSRAAVCGDTPADPQKRPVPGFRWG